MKFFTKEWLDDLKVRTGDAEFMKKTKAMTVSVQVLLTSCPGETDRMLDVTFQKGQIIAGSLEEKPMPSDWRSASFDDKKYMTRLIASYDDFGKVSRGEVAAVQAISSGMLSIRGDPMKMMAKIGELNAFIELMKTIPTDF